MARKRSSKVLDSVEAEKQDQTQFAAKQLTGAEIDADETQATAASTVTTEKPKLLTLEAFQALTTEFRRFNQIAGLPYLHAQFPNRPETGGSVTLAEMTEKIQAWSNEGNGESGYTLAPDANNVFRMLVGRNPSSKDADEIVKIIGKRANITLAAFEPWLAEKRETIGLDFDGEEAVACSMHSGKFRPTVRFLTDKRTGEVRQYPDGKSITIGNFCVTDLKPKNYDVLKERGAIILETADGRVVLAICRGCRDEVNRKRREKGEDDLRTYPLEAAKAYLERQVRREIDREESISAITDSLRPQHHGGRDTTPGRPMKRSYRR